MKVEDLRAILGVCPHCGRFLLGALVLEHAPAASTTTWQGPRLVHEVSIHVRLIVEPLPCPCEELQCLQSADEPTKS